MTQPMAIHKGTVGDTAPCGLRLYSNMKFKTTWRGVTCGGCLAVQQAQKNPNRKGLKVHRPHSKGPWALHQETAARTNITTDWRKVTCKTCRKLGGKASLKS